MGKEVQIVIKNIQDFRNYKVSYEKSMKILGYKPKYDVKKIVEELIEKYDYFKDFSNPAFYNIEVFKKLSI